MGRTTEHDDGTDRAASDLAHATTHGREQAGGGEPAGHLPAAALQQDSKVQHRCAVTGVSVTGSDNRCFWSSLMSISSSVSSNSIRFRGLDAWRGFSALLIVLYHFTDQHK